MVLGWSPFLHRGHPPHLLGREQGGSKRIRRIRHLMIGGQFLKLRGAFESR
jgi:hypothetical protein